MLATQTSVIPTGPDWVHEVKWDGMRVLIDIDDRGMTISSRTGRDITAGFPELAGLAGLYEDMLLDGEIVAMVDGRPSFAALTERMHVTNAAKAAALSVTRPVTFLVFDVLRLFGAHLTGQSWTARRSLLERLELSGRSWQVPPTYDDGEELFAATRDQELEGIVSKRRSSTYAAGRRSSDWLKSPHRISVSVIVGGWRTEVGSTAGRLGAVLVGLPDGQGGWRYAGRVGSGLAGSAGVALRALLAPLTRAHSPFSDEVPPVDAEGTRWVDPSVVVEVRTLGHAPGQRLRQPAFLGVRADLTPADLTMADDDLGPLPTSGGEGA